MVINEINLASLMGKETESLALDMTMKNTDTNGSSASNSSDNSFQGLRSDEGGTPRHNSVDEELTNLTWLQDKNLLKNLCVGNGNVSPSHQHGLENSTLSDSIDGSIENVESCMEDYDLDEIVEGKKPQDRISTKSTTYDPLVNVSYKPPYSFSCLIFMAIEDSPAKALPVKEIYSWIVHHFPYFQHAPDGWKNSVRHNLSLNKCFSKLDKYQGKGNNIGKGSLWCTDPEFRPNLLQALKRAPYCTFSQLQDITKTTPSQETSQPEEDPNTSALFPEQSNANVPSPYLFPYLSKRLSFSSVKSHEVDAAATMLALKMATSSDSDSFYLSKKQKRKFYLRVGNGCNGKSRSGNNNEEDQAGHSVSSSVDHTYSAAQEEAEPLNLKHINNNNYSLELKRNFNSMESSSEEDEEPVLKLSRLEGPRVLTERLDEEQRSLTEGAQALMSLANIAKIKRESLEMKQASVITRR